MPTPQSGPKRPPRPGSAARSSANGRAGATISAPAASEAAAAGVGDDATAVTVAPEPTSPPAADPVEAPNPTPAPVPVAHAPAGRRRRGRRVKRVVRRIDLWSVLKLSLVVYTCLYAAILATLAALWGIAYSSGTIDNLQSFLADVGLDNFTFYGNQMFRAAAAVGAVGVMAGTVVTVLATALVNVISEITGGIRLVVIEEDVDR